MAGSQLPLVQRKTYKGIVPSLPMDIPAPAGEMTVLQTLPAYYLLFLLLLETGIKLEELFALKVSHFDFSNKYSPEMYIKHTGKKEKKSRKLKLPVEIQTVFSDYVTTYKVDDLLFPYTQRFVPVSYNRNCRKSRDKKEGFRANFKGYVRGPAAEKGRGD